MASLEKPKKSTMKSAKVAPMEPDGSTEMEVRDPANDSTSSGEAERDEGEEETTFNGRQENNSAKKFGVDEMDLIEELDEEEDEQEIKEGRNKNLLVTTTTLGKDKVVEENRVSTEPDDTLKNDTSEEKSTPPKFFPTNRVSPAQTASATDTTPNKEDGSTPFPATVEAWSRGEITQGDCYAKASIGGGLPVWRQKRKWPIFRR